MPVNAQKKKSSKISPKTPIRKKVSKTKNKTPLTRFCPLCGRSSKTQKSLIGGPNDIFICDECIEVCVKVLFQVDSKDWQDRLISILTKPQSNKEKSTKRKVKKDKA